MHEKTSATESLLLWAHPYWRALGKAFPLAQYLAVTNTECQAKHNSECLAVIVPVSQPNEIAQHQPEHITKWFAVVKPVSIAEQEPIFEPFFEPVVGPEC